MIRDKVYGEEEDGAMMLFPNPTSGMFTIQADLLVKPETTIQVFDEVYPIELSLSERSDMKYPILIGRKFLDKRFIVDSSLKTFQPN